MFRELGRLLQNQHAVFLYHPIEHADYLERVWAARPPGFRNIGNLHPDSLNFPGQAGGFFTSSRLFHLAPPAPLPNPSGNVPIAFPPLAPNTAEWHHLIYAYMIEKTGIWDIFCRVIKKYLHGEWLGVPTEESQLWLRCAEELLFKPPPPFAIYGVSSAVRADSYAARRNAYFRMFGLSLPPAEGEKTEEPDPYLHPPAGNRDFMSTFQKFLHEVWVGIVNAGNIVGADPTHDHAVADLAQLLEQMLNQRRQYGNLTREEFQYVATMSWLHHTVDFNSPIVTDLRAEGTSESQRLKKIGAKIGVPVHPQADACFKISEALSRILTQIETAALNNVDTVPALYGVAVPNLPPGVNPQALRSDLETIITYWAMIFGCDPKADPMMETCKDPTAPRKESGLTYDAMTGCLYSTN